MPPKNSYVSMADIARKAGVSKSTVFLALRNSPRITPECRERIQQTAAELGYKTDTAVAALMANIRKGKIPTAPANLAIILGRVLSKHSWLGHYQEGIMAEARRLKYGIETYILSEWRSGDALGRVLEATGVKGVFLCGYAPTQARFKLPWDKFSWVVAGRCKEAPEFTRVAPDTYHAVKQMLVELTRRGYRRIGLVARYDETRRIGAYFGQATVGNILSVPPLVTPNWDREETLRWLKETKPDGVIASSDDVINWMLEAGIAIPEEMGFAHALAGNSAHPCSGMDIDWRSAGSIAVLAMDGQLRHHQMGIPQWAVTHSIPGKWMDGRTTRGLASMDNRQQTTGKLP